MYDQDLEGLDAVGKLSAVIASALLSHKEIALMVATSDEPEIARKDRELFAEHVVGLAKAIADKIITTHQLPKS